jgi:hypothetical protein
MATREQHLGGRSARRIPSACFTIQNIIAKLGECPKASRHAGVCAQIVVALSLPVLFPVATQAQPSGPWQIKVGTFQTSSSPCLDADLATIDQNRTYVQLWACWGGQNQLWYLNDDGTIVNAQSGRCLDADLATINNQDGTIVQLWDCWGGQNQAWRFGASKVYNQQSNTCLDAALETYPQNGTTIQLFRCTFLGGPNQDWGVLPPPN